MGPIQSGINQSLAILSLASSQSPQAQAQRKATADTKAFNKFRKTDEKTPFALGEKSQEMFTDLQQEAIQSNLRAGRTEDLLDISKAKPETENIKDYIRGLGEDFNLTSDSVERLTNNVFEGIKNMSPDTSSKEVKDMVQETLKELNEDEELNQMRYALKQSNNRLSVKKRIKGNMNMLKNTLKEDE